MFAFLSLTAQLSVRADGSVRDLRQISLNIVGKCAKALDVDALAGAQVVVQVCDH